MKFYISWDDATGGKGIFTEYEYERNFQGVMGVEVMNIYSNQRCHVFRFITIDPWNLKRNAPVMRSGGIFTHLHIFCIIWMNKSILKRIINVYI